MTKTLISLTSFLILNSCVAPPKAQRFKADWKILKVDGEVRACLKQEDVVELRELLIKCQSK